MKKLDAEQARPARSENGQSELTERELMAVSGGDGPPGTAGDGNGRVYLRGLMS
jgi:bacteriocin-like protein